MKLRLQLSVWTIWLLLQFGVEASLLPGLGLDVGFPICAFCCARSLSQNALSCSSDKTRTALALKSSSVTTPDCYASNIPYLTSLAYCVKTRCASAGLSAADVDTWWDGPVPCLPGSGVNGQPIEATPQYTYADTLYMIEQAPTKVILPGQLLNVTSLVDDATYQYELNSNNAEVPSAQQQAQYGLSLMIALMVLPILLTWVYYIPGARFLIDKIKPYLVYRPLFGDRHNRIHPLLRGYVPTVGHSMYIFVVFILTFIFCAVGYDFSGLPNSVGPDKGTALLNWLIRRTGCYGFALLPIVFLFAGRNNLLLYVTNWSHSTFMLLHRWVSRMWALLAILHSILAWAYVAKQGIYSETASEIFWTWGIVATATTVVLVVASGTIIRGWSYNFFLALHIIMTVITIVGCWYHVWLTPYGVGPYYNVSQDWLYIALAIWGFDRLARLARMVYNGMRRAVITEIDDETVRIDVKGVRWDPEPGKHLYVYFPTLHPLRPWENHPFSWTPTALLRSYNNTLYSIDAEKGLASSSDVSQRTPNHDSARDRSPDSEASTLAAQKHQSPVMEAKYSDASGGITLFVRKSNKGTTKLLRASDNLLVFIDGPYHNNNYKSALRTDRLLLIGGGVGISGLLPWMRAHPNVKLAWSVRESTKKMVDALSDAMDSLPDKEIRIGQRLDIQGLIDAEVAAGWSKVGVVVCGPGAMADAVRTAVLNGLKKGNTTFELDVDAYTW